MKGNVTNTGYWPDSPDRNNDFNIIPSNNITMEGMDMPLMGVSNKGDKKLMVPGKNYKFKGESVMETPVDKGMFLGAYKQVGGQLVLQDTDMASFQKGGEPTYVYSKKDPAYQKYLKQKAYYDKQKAIYEMPGSDYDGTLAYDDFAELTYRNAEYYKEKFDPEVGKEYTHKLQPNQRAYIFRKPTPVILEEESNPKAIDIKRLPTQPVDIKPVLQNIPRPQTNKQRVVVNTPQGDKVRVQDIKTKRFIDWEETDKAPVDIENPSGTASQDFPEMRRVPVPPGGFANGGNISTDNGIFLGAYKQVGGQLVPQDISVPNLSRQEGGSPYDIPAESYRDPKFIRDAEDREYYDPLTETIHMRSSYPNVVHEQWVKDHETAHHNQKLKGKLSSTENWSGPLKEPVVPMSEDEVMAYYNRGNIDVNNLIDAVPESTLFGMPDDVIGYGFQLKTYGTPGTAEYEASNTRNSTPRTLYRGKPVAKNAVAKTLNREEKDPEMMFKDKYNTELTKEEEKDFDKWAEEESKKQGRDILMDKGAYDVQGFWKSGDWKNRDADNHGTDTWKKPNHPTFSNQSKYNGAGGWYGGNWTEDAGYQPSKQSLNNYGPDYYNWMFGEEPNRPEHLDMSRYDGRNSPTPVVYKKGGSVKKVKIKSLPNNWKTQ
jgi:hypothetical protein